MPVYGISLTTIVTPATSTDLVALADFKTMLDIDGEQDDSFIGALIARASSAAANYCNRTFALETVLDEAWPDRDPDPAAVPGGVGRLQLSRWPIVGTPAVLVDGLALVDGVDVRTDAARGQLIRLGAGGYPCPWLPAYLAVTYQAGYAKVPADLADAVLRLMRIGWFARARDPALRSESASGVWSASYAPGMPPDVADLLANYRVPVLG